MHLCINSVINQNHQVNECENSKLKVIYLFSLKYKTELLVRLYFFNLFYKIKNSGAFCEICTRFSGMESNSTNPRPIQTCKLAKRHYIIDYAISFLVLLTVDHFNLKFLLVS